MNFLRNKKLKHLGAYLLLLTVLIFVVQFFILGQQIDKLEQAELRQDYTRIVQVANQQIALEVQDYLNGNKALAPKISSELDEQERRLKVLASGGRVEQREAFVQPLHRLPRITFEAMKDDWAQFRESVITIINEQAVPNPPVQSTSNNLPSDSTSTPMQVPAPVLVSSSSTSSLTTRYHGQVLSMTKWFDRIMADLHEEVEGEKGTLSTLQLVITLFNIIVVGGVYFLFYQFVLQPLNRLKKNAGTFVRDQNATADEIGEVAKNINSTVEQLKDASDFVMAIGKGNLSVDYKNSFDHNYVPGTNQLADSLIEMQAKLKELNEEEQKRQWANEGLTRFVDILRASNDNLHVLGDKVIAALVQYTKANQGGLYILNDEEVSNKHLELISLFAFDIKKHEQQRIRPGQGILGQAFLEKETTYLTSLPDEYIRISSGLGGANPRSILIVPLKVDRDVYGLVELASFNDFQAHEIAFVEKLGESIASTLASVRATQRNKALIEQFQQQTEQMKAQEEEMRQNMEELQATQEEVVRKEKNYISRISELEKALHQSHSSATATDELRKSFLEKEEEYKRSLVELEKALEVARKKAEDWEVATELARTLRFNLEALKIAGEQSRPGQ